MRQFDNNLPGPDCTLVKQFSVPRDRSAARVFVGRQDIIRDIENNCRYAMEALRLEWMRRLGFSWSGGRPEPVKRRCCRT